MLWVLAKDGPTLCLGKVRLNNKFCIKECAEGKNHCGVNRHSSKFEVVPDTAYIQAMDNRVLSAPCLDLESFTRAQRAELMSASMSASDWEACFQAVQMGEVPDWLIVDEGPQDDNKNEDAHSVQLLSPVASKERLGVFQIVPNFSFESTVSDEDKYDDDGLGMASTEGRVKRLEGKLVTLKEKLARPFLDIDASYTVMTTDLMKLHDKVKHVTGVLGSVRSPEMLSHWMESMTKQVKALEDFKNVAGVKFATFTSNQNSFKDELNNTMEEVAELQASVQQVQGWTVGAEQTLEVFKKCFNVIFHQSFNVIAS